MKSKSPQISTEGLSPMDPPQAYSPPGKVESFSEKDLHPTLKRIREDHTAFQKEIDVFEKALLEIQKEGLNQKRDQALRNFFQFFDNAFMSHCRQEEKDLFPLLAKRLIEKGEHSTGPTPTTAVDVLENDHVKALQLTAITFNFLGLSVRLPDERSRLLVLDTALEQGKSLVELLKLHIFRENNVVLPLAQQHLTQTELDNIQFQTNESETKLRNQVFPHQ